jgi:lipoprotein signal peptidase
MFVLLFSDVLTTLSSSINNCISTNQHYAMSSFRPLLPPITFTSPYLLSDSYTPGFPFISLCNLDMVFNNGRALSLACDYLWVILYIRVCVPSVFLVYTFFSRMLVDTYTNLSLSFFVRSASFFPPLWLSSCLLL